jgi:hypothetical protein
MGSGLSLPSSLRRANEPSAFVFYEHPCGVELAAGPTNFEGDTSEG